MTQALVILVSVVGAIALLLIALEIGLRSFLGFGKPLLYKADAQIGYLLVPNQRTRRFGNHIAINQFSMRCDEFSPQRSPDTFRILLLGDSIVNGGWWTDQQNTISALLQKNITHSEVLNASANSWGPRNELAYLQRLGSFESQLVVLVINTDDLFATAPTSLPVGRDRNYPNQLPASAISEAFSRYAIKAQPIPEMAALQKEGGDRVGINLEAIRQIKTFVKDHNGQMILALTPLLRELNGGGRDYEKKARLRLVELTEMENIPFIDFLPEFDAIGNAKEIYHDHIHFNLQGNQQITQRLLKTIRPFL